MRTYHWDFFGPRAKPTAEHFQRHLAAFLSEHGCTGTETGSTSSGALHVAIFCRAPPDWQAAIERALKPRRVTDD
jgi:hypothetical protein